MKRKKITYLVVLALVAILFAGMPMNVSATGPPPDIEWVDQFGVPGGIYDQGRAIHADGDVYAIGFTEGALPGQTSAGGLDAYIRKYDTSGTELWTHQFGTPADDGVWGFYVDGSGVYIAGHTGGTFPGQTSSGGNDVFVRKYDHDGNEIWTLQFGTSGHESASSICVDGSGIYVAGRTNTAFPGQTFAGWEDAFVRKYDHNLNELWTREFGTVGRDYAGAIAVYGSGIYVSGRVDRALPGQTWYGWVDCYIRKYDPNGNELWTRQFGTSHWDDPYHTLSVDATGVYISGRTMGTLPGQTMAGYCDAFVRKYDHAGNELWTRQFGTTARDEAWSTAVDSSGVYVTGFTDDILPGQTSSGGRDAFLRKYDLDGNELWTIQFGTSSFDMALWNSVDSSGVYVTGLTEGAFPGHTNAGGWDIFVAKFSFGCTIDQLIDMVNSAGLPKGITQSLLAKLYAAKNSYDEGRDHTGNNQLGAFINHVEALKGKKIPMTTADEFIAKAGSIIAQH
ncbi:MAG: hypothetical protein JSV56_08495 [Methanomassiliicoccales archaeon]|nr:MAG: hypothetical protein JSV56_08495 [Methanomassiliicoccales archaeon]